ncbi:MAG: hypothetical protein HFJ47_01175, partial [Clostridia bacterium]|nr:hypothetical protein [Clostridia bacterium]
MRNKKENIVISIISIVIAITVSAIIIIAKANQLNIKISSDLTNVKVNTVITEIEAKSAKAFLNSKLNVTNVIETDDRGYLVVGNLKAGTINLGNDISISNDVYVIKAMIIKYDSNWNPQWAHTLDRNSNSGGVYCGDDSIEAVIQTKDGGYVVGGYFKSNQIYPDPNHISISTSLKNTDGTKRIADGMIIKYDESGNYEWSKRYGTSGKEDKIKSIIENKDGSFFIVGTMDRNDFIIKYDSLGNEQWSKTLSGDGTNLVATIIETKDGGYLLGGSFSSSRIELSSEITLQPIQDSLTRPSGMIIKFDSSGTVQWADSISGNRYDYVMSIMETEDGGYIVAGETSSQTLKGQNNHGYNATYDYRDWFFIKYNISGEMEWTNLVGESKSDYLYEAIGTEDSGYIVIGSINYNELIIKYDSSSNEQWRKTINLGNIYSILQTEDKGYIVTGQITDSSADLGNNVNINNNGQGDVVIIKYDSLGNTLWAKVIGGTESEKMKLIAETRPGEYLLMLQSYSLNINLENNIIINETTSGWKDIIIKYESTIDKISPIIKVNPTSGEYIKSRKLTIETEDEGGSELSKDNTYEYYLSTSETELEGGEWKDYKTEREVTIGEGKTGTYYVYVKRVKDNGGNTSTSEGEIVLIGEREYHRYGPYKFDNIEPTITRTEVENNKVKIEAKDEDSGVMKYRYIASGTRITNPRITETNSIEVEATGEIRIENINEIRYIYILAEDRVGNTSKIEEVEIPKITIEGETNLETENGKGGVDLSWNIGTAGEKTYKIYQKSEREEEWKEVGITNETRITIETATDKERPAMPEIEIKGISKDKKIIINQTAEDNGSTYKFYVEACDREDTEVVLSTSEEITKEVKTGIKGYYYTIDEGIKEIEEREEGNEKYIEENTIELDIENNGKNIKIKAVDVAGNIGEESNVLINIPSTVVVKLNGGEIGGNTEEIELEGLVGQTIEIGTPEREGYTFTGWTATGGTVEGTEYTYGEEAGEVTAGWEINNYGYTIEYYYEGIKEESKTIKEQAEYGRIITEYENKVIEGYKLEKTENLPLTITVEEGNNIIKIYYVIDEENTKEVSYKVEYYKEGQKVEEDTQTVKETVQILQPNTIQVNQEEINTTNKYPGYKC